MKTIKGTCVAMSFADGRVIETELDCQVEILSPAVPIESIKEEREVGEAIARAWTAPKQSIHVRFSVDPSLAITWPSKELIRRAEKRLRDAGYTPGRLRYENGEFFIIGEKYL